MALGTVEQFLARLDPQTARELTSSQEDGEGAIDEVRVQAALDDANAEIEAYRPRIPAAHWPGDATVRMHERKVATYLLCLARPGKEFESIRNAYTDVIAYYKGLTEGASGVAAGSSPIGGSGCAPDLVFTDESLEGIV